jgi:hypothetical protein
MQLIECQALADSGIPQNVTMTMPSIVNTTEPAQSTLTPAQLLRPMPSIVNNQPVELATCTPGWAEQNPGKAVVVLVALAWAFGLFGKGK